MNKNVLVLFYTYIQLLTSCLKFIEINVKLLWQTFNKKELRYYQSKITEILKRMPWCYHLQKYVFSWSKQQQQHCITMVMSSKQWYNFHGTMSKKPWYCHSTECLKKHGIAEHYQNHCYTRHTEKVHWKILFPNTLN